MTIGNFYNILKCFRFFPNLKAIFHSNISQKRRTSDLVKHLQSRFFPKQLTTKVNISVVSLVYQRNCCQKQ